MTPMQGSVARQRSVGRSLAVRGEQALVLTAWRCWRALVGRD